MDSKDNPPKGPLDFTTSILEYYDEWVGLDDYSELQGKHFTTAQARPKENFFDGGLREKYYYDFISYSILDQTGMNFLEWLKQTPMEIDNFLRMHPGVAQMMADLAEIRQNNGDLQP